MNQENNKCYRLYWLCDETGRRCPAGVAFYNDPQGDYRLKVDVFPEDKVIYLKPMSVEDNVVNYRVEAAIRKNGVVLHRSEIGTGHASLDDGFPIFMEIGPFTRTLIMEAA